MLSEYLIMDYFYFSTVAHRLNDKGWSLISEQHGTRVLCRLLKNDYLYEVSFPWNMVYNRVQDSGKVYGSVSHFCGYDVRPLFEYSLDMSEGQKWVLFNHWIGSMFDIDLHDLTPNQS